MEGCEKDDKRTRGIRKRKFTALPEEVGEENYFLNMCKPPKLLKGCGGNDKKTPGIRKQKSKIKCKEVEQEDHLSSDVHKPAKHLEGCKENDKETPGIRKQTSKIKHKKMGQEDHISSDMHKPSKHLKGCKKNDKKTPGIRKQKLKIMPKEVGKEDQISSGMHKPPKLLEDCKENNKKTPGIKKQTYKIKHKEVGKEDQTSSGMHKPPKHLEGCKENNKKTSGIRKQKLKIMPEEAGKEDHISSNLHKPAKHLEVCKENGKKTPGIRKVTSKIKHKEVGKEDQMSSGMHKPPKDLKGCKKNYKKTPGIRKQKLKIMPEKVGKEDHISSDMHKPTKHLKGCKENNKKTPGIRKIKLEITSEKVGQEDHISSDMHKPANHPKSCDENDRKTRGIRKRKFEIVPEEVGEEDYSSSSDVYEPPKHLTADDSDNDDVQKPGKKKRKNIKTIKNGVKRERKKDAEKESKTEKKRKRGRPRKEETEIKSKSSEKKMHDMETYQVKKMIGIGPFSVIGHWYIASGFLRDVTSLLDAFEKQESWRFSSFAKCWQELKFSLVYRGRYSFKELLEFTEEILQWTTKFLSPLHDGKWRIGALYTLYGLYYKHPIRYFCKIRLERETYEQLVRLIELYQVNAENPDPAYIFWKLEKAGAIHHVATADEMGCGLYSWERHQDTLDYEMQWVLHQHSAKAVFPEEERNVEKKLMKEYEKLKAQLLGDGTEPDRAMSYVHSRILSDVDLVLEGLKKKVPDKEKNNPNQPPSDSQTSAKLSDIGTRRGEIRDKAAGLNTTDNFFKRKQLRSPQKSAEKRIVDKCATESSTVDADIKNNSKRKVQKKVNNRTMAAKRVWKFRKIMENMSSVPKKNLSNPLRSFRKTKTICDTQPLCQETDSNPDSPLALPGASESPPCDPIGKNSEESAIENEGMTLVKKEKAVRNSKTATKREISVEVKWEMAVEDEETAIENEEAALENEETSLENEETPLENEEMTLENEETSLENEETPLENEEMNLENEETAVENEETAVENKGTALEKEETVLGIEEIYLENEEMAPENEEIYLENKEISVENEETVVLNVLNDKTALEKKESTIEKREIAAENKGMSVENDGASVEGTVSQQVGREKTPEGNEHSKDYKTKRTEKAAELHWSKKDQRTRESERDTVEECSSEDISSEEMCSAQQSAFASVYYSYFDSHGEKPITKKVQIQTMKENVLLDECVVKKKIRTAIRDEETITPAEVDNSSETTEEDSSSRSMPNKEVCNGQTVTSSSMYAVQVKEKAQTAIRGQENSIPAKNYPSQTVQKAGSSRVDTSEASCEGEECPSSHFGDSNHSKLEHAPTFQEKCVCERYTENVCKVEISAKMSPVNAAKNLMSLNIDYWFGNTKIHNKKFTMTKSDWECIQSKKRIETLKKKLHSALPDKYKSDEMQMQVIIL